MRQFILSWHAILWAVALCVFIVLGLMPHFPSLPAGFDKVLHFGAFFVLMFIPALTMYKNYPLMICALFLLFCGAGVELAQGLMPGREASLDDMLANGMGVCFGFIAGTSLRGFVKNKTQSIRIKR